MADSQLAKTSKSGGAVSVRQDLAEEVTVSYEIAPTAAAAAAKAEIEARIVAARKWPRSVDQFREDFLKDCRRPGFAEIALYRRPVGRKKNPETGRWEEAVVVDFSIRAVEAALAHFCNVHVAARIEWETTEQTKLMVAVIDVQKNVGYSTDMVLDKLVERKEVKQGRKARGVRENSYGDQVYLVEATKDEVRNLIGAERSKLIRDNGKRLLPRDILDEARELIDKTLADQNAKDPDSAKKKVLDRFASLGVSAVMLRDYLGRPLETLSAKDLSELQPLFNGLKEGSFTWTDVMRTRDEEAEGEEPKGKRPNLKDALMGPKPEPKPETAEPERGDAYEPPEEPKP